MAKAPTLTDIANVLNSASAHNSNNDAIQVSFENTLSRDGSTPNQMNANFDMNSNDIINVGSLDTDILSVAGRFVTPSTLGFIPSWEGDWATSTAYSLYDFVKQNGNVYLCLEAHTSGVFATDLAANKWVLLVTKGNSGAGSGDLLAVNNLSDVNDTTSARNNLNAQMYSSSLDVITSAGITGVSGSDLDLLTGTTGTANNLAEWNADGDIVDGPNLTGQVAFFALNSAPSGWLKANGAAISRTTYATLFSAIGTTFGVGDGSTTFNLPDLRGEFVRGWDDARGVDSGRVFGSTQTDAIIAHTHDVIDSNLSGSGSDAGGTGKNRINTTRTSFNQQPTGATETRPRNIALLACIRY